MRAAGYCAGLFDGHALRLHHFHGHGNRVFLPYRSAAIAVAPAVADRKLEHDRGALFPARSPTILAGDDLDQFADLDHPIHSKPKVELLARADIDASADFFGPGHHRYRQAPRRHRIGNLNIESSAKTKASVGFGRAAVFITI